MENETQPNEEAPLVPPAVSQAASALGRRGRGRAKTITDEDRQRRSDQMKEINEKRRTVRVQARMETVGTARMGAPLVGGTDPRQ